MKIIYNSVDKKADKQVPSTTTKNIYIIQVWPELWPPGDWGEAQEMERRQNQWPFGSAHFPHPSDRTEPTPCLRGSKHTQRLLRPFTTDNQLHRYLIWRKQVWQSFFAMILTFISVWYISTQRAGKICEREKSGLRQWGGWRQKEWTDVQNEKIKVKRWGLGES